MIHYLSKQQRIGLEGEEWTRAKLEKLGYSITVPDDFLAKCVDIYVNAGSRRIPIEVKTANQKWFGRTNTKGKKVFYPRWSWDVGCVTGENDLILVLIADTEKGHRHPFIMPGSVMETRTRFEINSHPDKYKGMIKPFLNNWDIVNFITSQAYVDPRQMDLFHKELEVKS